MEITLRDVVAVFMGGGLGSVARFLTGKAMIRFIPSSFPWGTLAANFLSCVALGIFVLVIAKDGMKAWWISFVIIGFCGGFSTFSTFSYETVKLLQEGQVMIAFANVLVSLVVCMVILYYLSKLTL